MSGAHLETELHPPAARPHGGRWRLLVTGLSCACVFGLFSSSMVPDVNEAHYWAKAKHFWDNSYCPGDTFLDSADAHWSFYMTLGQLTRWLPDDSAVWTGRCLVWLAMGLGWAMFYSVFERGWGRAVLSAALLVVLTRWCHLSGEWVVGGAEAKGLAFAAVFLALRSTCLGDWGRAYLWGGIAAGFHVLVGGWTVVCIAVAATLTCLDGLARASGQASEKRINAGPQTLGRGVEPPRSMHVMLGLVCGGIASLPGLWPALSLTSNAADDVAAVANQVYVLQRLPHHLVLWAFSPFQLLAFCSLVLAWIAWPSVASIIGTSRSAMSANLTETSPTIARLNRVVLAALGLGLIGLTLSVVVATPDHPSIAVRLLRYYWFRTADVFLPIGVIVTLCQPVSIPLGKVTPVQWSTETNTPGSQPKWQRRWILVAGLIMWDLAAGYRAAQWDPRPPADRASLPADSDPERTLALYRNWQKVCDWIKQETPTDAMFLTPRAQQTFKWYAQRSEVANWKDIPQDNTSIVEWYQRIQDCGPFWVQDYPFVWQAPIRLHEIIEKYQVDYVVLPQYAYDLRRRFGMPLPYERVYPLSADEKTSYVVLKTNAWARRHAPD